MDSTAIPTAPYRDEYYANPVADTYSYYYPAADLSTTERTGILMNAQNPSHLQVPIYVQYTSELPAPSKKESQAQDNDALSAWVVFGLGFLLPVLWFVGAIFIRSNNASAKAAGIASLCMGITAFLTAVILILIFVFAN